MAKKQMKALSISILLFACFMLTGFSQDISKGRSDTLSVAYTYWSTSGGPFTGMCGDSYSLVFTGTITRINKSSRPYTLTGDTTTVLYTPQYGLIEIKGIKFQNPPKEGYKKTPGKNYNGEQYFKSDCFYDMKLKEGDAVIVFAYSYEGEYSIPGNSILKIIDFDDPIVLSIEKYIKNDQDPLFIIADTTIWSKYGLDYSLKQIIDCRVSNKNGK